MRKLLIIALLLAIPAPTFAQTGLFGPRIAVAAQEPPPVTFTPDEARRIAHALSDAQTIAEDRALLKQSLELERQAKLAALGAAANYKTASELNAKRADTEAKRADNEATRATNESALKDVARAEVKAERRKGRFNLIKGVVFGLLVGAGAGIAIGYSH